MKNHTKNERYKNKNRIKNETEMKNNNLRLSAAKSQLQCRNVLKNPEFI